MPKRLKCLVFWCAFSFFLWSALITLWHHIGTRIYGPIIYVDSLQFDLGIVSQADKVIHKITIKNNGNAPLKIISVTPDCSGCIEILDYERKIILPEDRGFIDINFDPKQMTGKIQKKIIIKSNDFRNPILILFLTANITS